MMHNDLLFSGLAARVNFGVFFVLFFFARHRKDDSGGLDSDGIRDLPLLKISNCDLAPHREGCLGFAQR